MAARNGFQPGGDIFFDGGDSGRYVEDDIAVSILGVNTASFVKLQATDPTEPSGYATWVNADGSDVGKPATATGESVVIKRWSSSVASESMSPPVFVSISPNIGDVLGGTPVTVTLADAVNIDTVKVGGVPLTNLTITGPTTLTGVTGAHAAGNVSVEVVNAGGSDTEANAFTYIVSTPVLSVSPDAGDEAGGTVVTVEVVDSSIVTSVYFGTQLGTAFSVIDATHVQATTPAQSAGYYDVGVNVPYAFHRLQNAFAYRYSLSFAPVHSWKLDETSGLVANPSFGGLVGAHGSTVLVNQAGKIGRAPKYNNTGATALGSKTNFGSYFQKERNQPFSVSAWIRVNGGAAPIICAMRPISPFRGWLFNQYSSGFGLHLINTSGSNLIEVVSNVGTLTNNSWHHVVATYDGSSTAAGVQLYFDGAAQAKVVNANSLSATIIDTLSEMLIGGRGNNVTVDYGPIQGEVDDVALFNGVLTAADVAKMYARGNSGASVSLSYAAGGAFVGISPSQGSAAGGSSATITVSTTAGVTAVRLGGALMTNLVAATETTLTGLIPAHAAGIVDCDVYYADGSVSTGVAAFTYVQSTPVTNISPDEGDEAGNTLVTLTVGNSALVSTVYFGSALATNLVVVDATHVQCRTPANAPQATIASVNVPGAAEGAAFTYTFDVSARPTNVWQLDETAIGAPVADTGSPGGVPGTHQSAVLINQVGKVGRAAQYNNAANGMTGRTAMGANFIFERTQPFSACGWVKATAANAPIMDTMLPGGTYRGWSVEVIGTNLAFILCNNYFAPNRLQIESTGLNFQDNTWKHWAVTYDGTSTPGGVKIYGNGALLAMVTNSNTLSATTVDATSRFQLGSRSNDISSDHGPWPGLLDDSAIFVGTILTAADILKIYNEANAGASVRFAR
jgi:hypothetical protein